MPQTRTNYLEAVKKCFIRSSQTLTDSIKLKKLHREQPRMYKNLLKGEQQERTLKKKEITKVKNKLK